LTRRADGKATGTLKSAWYSVRLTSPKTRPYGAREAVERRVDERPADLAGAIRAEVHEHHDIAVVYRTRRLSRRNDKGALDELIGFPAGVGERQGLGGGGRPIVGLGRGQRS